MKSLNHNIACSWLSMLSIDVFSCDPQGASPTLVTVEECELAVVFLFDTSGSMGQDVNGETLLHKLADTTISIVRVIPPDLWTVGLVTFPNDGLASWGMELLTDANRQSLILELDALTPSGGSDIMTGLWLAGYMLQQYPHMPRFLVIFSDGAICQYVSASGTTDCGPPLNVASTLKSEGIHIITMGYNLPVGDPDDEGNVPEGNVLRDMASVDDGESLFFNTGSADDLYRWFLEKMGELCSLLDVRLDVETSSFEILSGATASSQYLVTHVQGDAREVRVLSQVGGRQGKVQKRD